jgi:hypothetical protein
MDDRARLSASAAPQSLAIFAEDLFSCCQKRICCITRCVIWDFPATVAPPEYCAAIVVRWGRVHAEVQLEIVRRYLLRPRRRSGNDRNCVGMPAPQLVIRGRIPGDLVIRPNHRRRIPSALGVGFSQLTPIDPSSSRQSSGLPRPCRRLCRSARHCSLTLAHT